MLTVDTAVAPNREYNARNGFSLPFQISARSMVDMALHPDWTFGVSSGAAVERLARTVGFWFRWDEPTAQFDHPALLVAVDRGRVVRLMVGGTAEPVRLLEVVRELRGGFVAACPRPGRVLFRCFQYDPRTGRFALGWGFLLLAVPATLTLLGTPTSSSLPVAGVRPGGSPWSACSRAVWSRAVIAWS